MYKTILSMSLFTAFVALIAYTAHAAEPITDKTGKNDLLPKPPNIILIMADDLGYGELGCYGQQIIKTPNIDNLAKQGLRFTQYYAGSPVCAPSRCTLMTGKHTGHAAIRDNRRPKGMKKLRDEFAWEFPGQTALPNSEVTIAELLKANQYDTAGIGKWGLGMPGTSGDPNKQGFDLFYGYLCQVHAHNHYPKFLLRNDVKEPQPGNDGGVTGQTYSQDQFTNEAIKFISERREKPFFLYLPVIIPHVSIQVPESSLAQYTGKIPDEPYNGDGHYAPSPTPHAAYAAMISHLDAAVDKIVSKVDELDLAENTIIIFTSDNGATFKRVGGSDSTFFNSTGPLRDRKGSTYEGGLRVPFIARWPGKIAAGTETNHVAAHWDVLPTLCDIVKVDKPQKLDGISFADTLLGKGEQPEHEYLYWEFPAFGFQQAVRSGDWKIVRHGVDTADTSYELYDLATDISEQHDVAAQHPDIVQRLASYGAKAHKMSNLFPLFAAEKEKAAAAPSDQAEDKE
jgi:arylsulfatase A